MRRPLAVRATTPRSGTLLWSACCAGREPAESLDPRDREDLVADLLDAGWSLVDVAVHTRMSTYTTARIADRIGHLPRNPAVLGDLEADAQARLAPPEFTARMRQPGSAA